MFVYHFIADAEAIYRRWWALKRKTKGAWLMIGAHWIAHVIG
jgi:hypothetical protein